MKEVFIMINYYIMDFFVFFILVCTTALTCAGICYAYKKKKKDGSYNKYTEEEKEELVRLELQQVEIELRNRNDKKEKKQKEDFDDNYDDSSEDGPIQHL